MGKYLTEEEMEFIREKTKEEAEEIMKTVPRETIEEINTKKWSKQEKWYLIWSIEYANQ